MFIRVTVTCTCGAKYDLTDAFQHIGVPMCPNCHKPVDDNNERAIQNIISGARLAQPSDAVSSLSVTTDSKKESH